MKFQNHRSASCLSQTLSLASAMHSGLGDVLPGSPSVCECLWGTGRGLQSQAQEALLPFPPIHPIGPGVF